MSIKCSHCGGRHAKLETVRQCAIDSGVDEKLLPQIKRDMWLPTMGQSAPVRHKPGLPPAGYYLLDGDIVAKIRIPNEGRWAGRYFVSACGKPGNTEKAVFPKKGREEFLKWLVGQGTTRFMIRYGMTTGFCPACGGVLDFPEKKMGYHRIIGPYGSACAEAVQGKYTIAGG